MCRVVQVPAYVCINDLYKNYIYIYIYMYMHIHILYIHIYVKDLTSEDIEECKNKAERKEEK